MTTVRRRRRLGVGAIGVGAVLVAVGLTHLTPAPAADFGAPAASAPVEPAPSAPVSAPVSTPMVGNPTGAGSSAVPPPTDVAASVTGSATSVDPPPTSKSPAAVATPPTPAPDRPVRVTLERLGVSADIEDVLSVDGVLQVPEDPLRVGWWAASSMAGEESGTTVLDGHVDSATKGLGFFSHLRDLTEGDVITVTTAAGNQLSYAVESRQTFPKSAGLPGELFTRDGPAALVLVTCGGPFDRSKGSYEDNIAVTARPV